MSERTETFCVTVNVIVKAPTALEADSIVCQRLNDWFHEDLGTEPPFPHGSLLLWNYAKDVPGQLAPNLAEA